MRFLTIILFFTVLLFSFSCVEKNPNLNEKGKDEFESLTIKKPVNKSSLVFNDTIYVPIYSDIYVDKQNPKHLLSSTLSIRNTSFTNHIYISKINYYNTQGSLVKEFITKPINLPPMATVNYVIEKDDDTGGTGANFIVVLESTSQHIKPIIQAVMVGEYSNKAFSFITDGYSVKY